jgi:nucleotide-binding universal stress UspA family protein
MASGPLVVGFDGSPAAEHALREGGRLLAPRPALVVVVWEAGLPFMAMSLPTSALDIPPAPIAPAGALRLGGLESPETTEGETMTVCRIIETGVAPETYDKVSGRLDVQGSPPDGQQVHVAAVGDDGKIRIVELWDSREQAQEFGEKVRAAREEVGVSFDGEPVITYLEVHNVVGL